jgi:hypothetical protein
MNYLIRWERVNVFIRERFVEIIEDAPGRWRPHEGDTLLITRGSNLELEFKLFVTVQATRDEATRLDGERAVRLVIKGELVAEGRHTLGEMMYSLLRVANFSRPGLNLRHHSRVNEEDYRRILAGDINARRSLYFGVLQFLPRQWREYVDLAAQELNARRRLAPDGLVADERHVVENPRWPLDSLIQVIDRHFVETVRVAARAGVRRAQLPPDLRGPLAELDPSSGRTNPWLDHFLSWAERNEEQLVNLRNAVADAAREHAEEEPAPWRAHRW